MSRYVMYHNIEVILSYRRALLLRSPAVWTEQAESRRAVCLYMCTLAFMYVALFCRESLIPRSAFTKELLMGVSYLL